MELKLNEVKFNEKVKELHKQMVAPAKRLLRNQVSFSVIGMVLGYALSYMSYIKFGIDSPFKLASFILGIMLCCVGFSTLFTSIGEFCAVNSASKEFGANQSDCDPRLMGLQGNIKSSKIEFMDKYINVKEMSNQANIEGFRHILWSSIKLVSISKEGNIFLFSDDGVIKQGICLSDMYEGYSKDTVLQEIKKHLPEGNTLIDDGALSDEEIFRTSWISDMYNFLKKTK